MMNELTDNMTTAEILRHYRYLVTTPLEKLLFDRLDQADDKAAQPDDLQAIADLVTDMDTAIVGVRDELESIIQVHDDLLADNEPLSDAIHELMERTDDNRDIFQERDNAIEWDNIIE